MVVIDVEATGKKMHRMAKEKYKMRHFSEMLGLTSSSVMYHWFNGDRMPCVDKLFQIADLLDCKVDELVVTRRIGND